MYTQANFHSEIMSVKALEVSAQRSMCDIHLPMYSPRRKLNVNMKTVRAVSLLYHQEKLTTKINIKTKPSGKPKMGR